MRSTPVREVEHKRRGKPGLLLAGLAVLAAAVILLWGTVRIYELRKENLRLESELRARENILSRLELESAAQGDLLRRAQALGLQMPDAEQTVILHLRGMEKEHTGR